jgi:hypothetical protein
MRRHRLSAVRRHRVRLPLVLIRECEQRSFSHLVRHREGQPTALKRPVVEILSRVERGSGVGHRSSKVASAGFPRKRSYAR